MRRWITSLCIFATSYCVTQSAEDPLVFGMTKPEVAAIFQLPWVYLTGRPGSERYAIFYPSTVPGIYPVDAKVVVQFRRGRLTGWRRDWQMQPRTWF